MSIFHYCSLALALTLTAAACDSSSDFVADATDATDADSLVDVAPDATTDVTFDTGSDVAIDVATDVQTVVTCEPAVCDSTCATQMPGSFGACRTDGCHCFGGTVVDAGEAVDASIDAPGFLGCTTNADCPSETTFCNGAGCGTPGFCYPRAIGSTCTPDGPRQCGCDGIWYANPCARQMAGVRLAPIATCGEPDGGTDVVAEDASTTE